MHHVLGFDVTSHHRQLEWLIAVSIAARQLECTNSYEELLHGDEFPDFAFEFYRWRTWSVVRHQQGSLTTVGYRRRIGTSNLIGWIKRKVILTPVSAKTRRLTKGTYPLGQSQLSHHAARLV
jgi:hypothetical protein